MKEKIEITCNFNSKHIAQGVISCAIIDTMIRVWCSFGGLGVWIFKLSFQANNTLGCGWVGWWAGFMLLSGDCMSWAGLSVFSILHLIGLVPCLRPVPSEKRKTVHVWKRRKWRLQKDELSLSLSLAGRRIPKASAPASAPEASHPGNQRQGLTWVLCILEMPFQSWYEHSVTP